MTILLALDPGPTETGWVLYGDERVLASGVKDNHDLLAYMHRPYALSGDAVHVDHLAVEMIASYGLAVGREVFETVLWIGRFMQAWRDPEAVRLIYRRDVKLHLCGTSKAKDPNVRQALLDMFQRSGGGATPQIGIKSKPGPLYGVSSHAWAALGVAVTACAQLERA